MPARVTLVPTGPEAGRKLVTAGSGVTLRTVNPAALVALPPGVVTVIAPVVAPGGTVAVSCVSEATVKPAARAPLKRTAVAPLKPVPVMVTSVPTGPEAGRKLVTVRDGVTLSTVKLAALVALPPGVVTVMAPVAASGGTVAVSCVSEATVKTVARAPPKRTAVAPLKPVPVMVTFGTHRTRGRQEARDRGSDRQDAAGGGREDAVRAHRPAVEGVGEGDGSQRRAPRALRAPGSAAVRSREDDAPGTLVAAHRPAVDRVGKATAFRSRALPERCARHVAPSAGREDGAALAHRPAVRGVGEGDAAEGPRRRRTLPAPRRAAVRWSRGWCRRSPPPSRGSRR